MVCFLTLHIRSFPRNSTRLPILVVSPSEGKMSGSETERNSLQNEPLSEEKILMLTKNDSRSVFVEKQEFHSSGDLTQMQEGLLR